MLFYLPSANAIAPLRPENTIKCCIFDSILFFLDLAILMKNAKRYTFAARAIVIASYFKLRK